MRTKISQSKKLFLILSGRNFLSADKRANDEKSLGAKSEKS